MTNLNNELSINELDGVSGGEALGEGHYSTTLGGITFTHSVETGITSI